METTPTQRRIQSLANRLFPEWRGTILRVPVGDGRGGVAETWGMTRPGITILGATRAQAERTLKEMAAGRQP